MSISLESPIVAPLPLNRSRQRISLELLRFVSCIGIVWFHCNAPGAVFGYAGLPALIALSAALASVPGKSDPFPVIVAKRAKRLLIPWAVWCLIYGCKHMAASYLRSRPIFANTSWWMLTVGPAIHLWYLPFAFVMTCFVSLLQRIFWPSGGLSKKIVSSIAVAFFLPFSSYLLQTYSWPEPVSNWIFSVPALFIGLALPQMPPSRKCILYSSIIALTLCLVIFGDWWTGYAKLGIPYAVGTFLLIIAWLVPMSPNKYIEWMGQVSFGVYLTHPLFFSIARLATGSQRSAAYATIVVLLSIGTTAIMRRGVFRNFM